MKTKWHFRNTLIIILTMLTIVPFTFIKPSAQTLNANYSCTQFDFQEYISPSYYNSSYITINFKNPATGTLTVNATGIGGSSSTSAYYQIDVISGGVLTQINANNIKITLTDSSNVQIRVRQLAATGSNSWLVYSMSFSGNYSTSIESNVIKINQLIQNTSDPSNSILGKLDIIAEAINSGIIDYTSQINDVITLLNVINNKLAGLDNLIDTITWNDVSFTYKGVTSDFNTFSDTNMTASNSYYVFNLGYINNLAGDILKFVFPVYVNNQSSRDQLKLYYIRSDRINEKNEIEPLFYMAYRDRIEVYLTLNYPQLTPINTADNYIALFLPSGYNFSTIGRSVQNIKSTDIEYWKLMSTFQLFKLNASTSESIAAENAASDTNNQFQNNSDQYHSIESTFQSNFDISMQAINPTSILEDIILFAPAFSWFTQQLGAFYNASGPFKILFTLPLLLGIALFFIGRGVNVFHDPYKETSKEKYDYSETETFDLNTGKKISHTLTRTNGFTKRSKMHNSYKRDPIIWRKRD